MKILLLAGTPEARQIALALAQDREVKAVASLARAASAPVGMGLPTRIGGWGGEAAFADWLKSERIGAVLDATHPFAHRITARTHRVCERLGIEYMQFQRPAWVPGQGDRWTFLNNGTEAARHISREARILLMTGRRGVEAFENLADRKIYIRVRDRGTDAFPFPHGGFLHRPVRISQDVEEMTLRTLRIDWVIARNSGGLEGMPVLSAARALGLDVGMIRRPPQPDALRIRSVTEALAWARRRL